MKISELTIAIAFTAIASTTSAEAAEKNSLCIGKVCGTQTQPSREIAYNYSIVPPRESAASSSGTGLGDSARVQKSFGYTNHGDSERVRSSLGEIEPTPVK